MGGYAALQQKIGGFTIPNVWENANVEITSEFSSSPSTHENITLNFYLKCILLMA